MSAAVTESPFRVVHTVCSHDCPDSCAVLVTVDSNGRAVKVQGDPSQPVTNGFLCGKVAKYLDRVYAPDRILYPLKRKAGVAKGRLERGHETEVFERIGWDEALEAIAARLKETTERYGPESVLPYSYAGTIGVLGYGSMDRRFFHRLGASQLDRTICAEAGGQAWNLVYGKKLGTPTEDFKLAKLILAWAGNIHGNNVHLWPMVEQARRNGARLIVIDPYRTRTAALADWHIAIRPGTDAALALGMMNVILREGLEDRAYINDMTHGFEQLAERVREYTPERVAMWTGMTPGEVEQLAREYATTRPAAIRLNYGVQRVENGGTAVRAIAMLPALTGAWKCRGGGAQLSMSGAFSWNKQALERPDLAKHSPLGRLARVVNMSLLGQALTELGQSREQPAKEPAVHALFVYNSNPGAVAPNHNAVVRGLKRDDLFTVVHDLFFTDTTDYADYILPATTFLEHTDIQGAYGHYFVQLSNQAIDPPGEARSNVWLFGQLAQRMGFDEECFRDTPEEMIRQALAIGPDGHSTNPEMEHITIEELEDKGHVPLAFHLDPEMKPFQPFVSGSVPTPSGKIEFYSEALAAQGLDPLPAFVAPVESRWSEGAHRYPLEFLSRKNDNYMNSTFANLDGHRKMEKRASQKVEIHPLDAEARGIDDGDTVRVFNDRGWIHLTAMINGDLPAGVVAGRLDWAKFNPDAVNVNALTSERLTDIGAGATFYSTLVEVAKAGTRAWGLGLKCSAQRATSFSPSRMDNAAQFSLRLATEDDVLALHALIEASIRGLQANDYTQAQMEGALGTVLGLDTQLITDGTYFIAESLHTQDETGRSLAGCGGWSRRRTLFGADRGPGRKPDLLNPATDAAKVRAIFVHPQFARRGLGSLILATVENAARAAGFRKFEMGSTLTGVPLYRLKGYVEVERIAVPLWNGEALPVVKMVKDA